MRETSATRRPRRLCDGRSKATAERGRDPYLQEAALEEREAYEASGSSLSFLEWLNEARPLPGFFRLP